MADQSVPEGFGCESGDAVVDVNQPKGAANKKKNKWKTVTAEFYQPKPYETDQGKGKAGGAGKGVAGKGGAGRGGEDLGAKGGRGGKGRSPQQDDGRSPKPHTEAVAKQPEVDTSKVGGDAPEVKGGGGEHSPKSKPSSGKPRDIKGKGKSKQAAPRKGMGPVPFDSNQDMDGPRPLAAVQPQRTALSNGQPAMGMPQHPATVMPHQMSQQMPQQMPQPAMVQQMGLAPFGGQAFVGGNQGSMGSQNPQAMPAMYAMPYYVPMQIQGSLYTSSSPFVPTAGQLSGHGPALGGPGGAGPGAKLQQAPLAGADRAVLVGQVQQQLEYYFDGENLVKDMFLRRNMTEEGWVTVQLIAGFRLIQSMTTDLSVVVEAIQASSKIELDIQKQFVRAKENWQNWVIGGSPVLKPAGDPAGLPGAR